MACVGRIVIVVWAALVGGCSSGPREIVIPPAASMASDSSYITHWLTWRDSNVEWKSVAPGQTAVTWTLRYRRRLDPAWYFVPIERYGARLAAQYLIETLATPR